MIKQLKYNYYKNGKKADRAIVAIHGWQGNFNSMKPLVNTMKIKNIDWYLIQAPYEVNKKANSFSWTYKKSNGEFEIDEPKNLLNDFFSMIFKKYLSHNIFIMGFSQGGLVCLDFVLYLESKVGGVFSIAGFNRFPDQQINRFHSCQKMTPILIAHGKQDLVIPVETSNKIYLELKNQGANVELLLYNGKHKIGIDCLRKIKSLIGS